MRQTFASREFGSHLEDEEQTKIKPATTLNADARKQILQNLQEDPTLYDYDSFLETKEKKNHERVQPNFRAEPKKSKYQDKLIQRAEFKKLEREIYQDQLRDKQIKRESKTNADPVAYVTDTYKEFMEEKRKHALRAEKDASKTISKGLAEFHKIQLGLYGKKDGDGKIGSEDDSNRTPSPERTPEKVSLAEKNSGQVNDRTSFHESIKLKEESSKIPLPPPKSIEAPDLQKRTVDHLDFLANDIQKPRENALQSPKDKNTNDSLEPNEATELTKEQKILLARKKFEERKKLKTT